MPLTYGPPRCADCGREIKNGAQRCKPCARAQALARRRAWYARHGDRLRQADKDRRTAKVLREVSRG